MTTLIVPVTTGWTNVTIENGLVAEQVYSIQNIGANSVIFYRGATPPGLTSTGHLIKPQDTWRSYKQELNIFLYFKVLGGSSLLSTLAVSRIIAGDSSGGGGGGGTPGGNIGNVQYKLDASTFGGVAEANYNATTNEYRIGSQSAVGPAIILDQTTGVITLREVSIANSTIQGSTATATTVNGVTLTALAAGTNYLSGAGTYTIPETSATPGGQNGQVQYNNEGSFSGVPGTNYSTTAGELDLKNTVINEVDLSVHTDGNLKTALYARLDAGTPKLVLLEDTAEFVVLNGSTPEESILVANDGSRILDNFGSQLVVPYDPTNNTI
jgi:hypothetical protein